MTRRLATLTTDQIRRPVIRAQRVGLRVGVAAAAGAMAVFGLHLLLRDADVLPLKQVRVQGVDVVVAHEIEAYLDLEKETPLFSIDLDAARKRVEEHPFIRSASLHRIPPETLVVDVVPREAVAVLALKRLYLLDQDGRPFKKAAPGDGLNLPLITGIDARAFELGEDRGRASRSQVSEKRVANDNIGAALDLIAVNATLTHSAGPLQEVHMDPALGPVMQYEAMRIRVGTLDPTEALRQLPEILSRLDRVGRRPAEIHLDNPRRLERVAVRLQPMSEMMGRGRDTIP